MPNIVYNSFFEKLMDNTIDLKDDTIKCCLLQGPTGSNPYTPNLTHVFLSNIQAYEVSGAGYTAGGKEVLNKTITGQKFDGDNVQWTAATIKSAYAVVYKSTGTPSTSPLICMMDLGGEKSVTNATFEIEFNSAGILTFAMY